MLEEIVAHERTLLGDRTKAAAATIDRANRVVKILVAFGTLIVLAMIVLGLLAVRALGQLASARAEAISDDRPLRKEFVSPFTSLFSPSQSKNTDATNSDPA